MNANLEDEILSINSIYGEKTLTLIESDIYSLQIPSLSTSLRIEFPLAYPDAPPSVLGTQSVGLETKGEGHHLVVLARDVLAQVYQPGLPCIFDLLEELGQVLQRPDSPLLEKGRVQQAAEEHGQLSITRTATSHNGSDPEQPSTISEKEPPWSLSEVVTERKSVFTARAARVSSPAEARSFLHHLLSTDKKVAKATHNITAWRIHGPNDTAFQDCDDDGETAAGGRLLHLMQLMDVWDVMVVVSRWYGGVQLGPDRFRIINSVARDALTRGDFANGPVKERKKKGTKTK
ncbi:hypothetical protein LTR66_007026 [Elasticomyces elasticus]|nr:hypothetical protein LTR66_007026 [Elasticomyces elasticus]KAK5001803.1 hypothetical protein LTR28_012205 [Elasticomyces elasticus]